MKTKYCKFCNNFLFTSNFNNHPNTIDKLNNKCKNCVKEYRQTYNKKNKNKILEYNISFNKTYNKKWGEKNPHIIRWRSLLNRCLVYQGKYKNTKTQIILGYIHQQFKDHIVSQFIKGMKWSNISVDHKIPLSWFKKTTPPHIVNDLRNLQPLFKKDNISKSNKYADKVDPNYWKIIQEYLN